MNSCAVIVTKSKYCYHWIYNNGKLMVLMLLASRPTEYQFKHSFQSLKMQAVKSNTHKLRLQVMTNSSWVMFIQNKRAT